jgi:hypothetical protein
MGAVYDGFQAAAQEERARYVAQQSDLGNCWRRRHDEDPVFLVKMIEAAGCVVDTDRDPDASFRVAKCIALNIVAEEITEAHQSKRHQH